MSDASAMTGDDPFGGLLEANAGYAAGFRHGHLDARPRRRLVLLTCMDARIDPHSALGLDLGDTVVLRNAGGRASDDALRSIAVAIHVLGAAAVAVMHHTGCGMATPAEELRAAIGPDAAGLDLLAIGDPADALRTDVERIRESPLVPAGAAVAGFRYDVHTGQVTLEVPAR